MTRTSMVRITCDLESMLSPSTGKMEVIYEESSDSEGPESSLCCNYAESKTKISKSLAVSGGSKIVS